MASTIIAVPQGVWTQITSNPDGSIRHKSGTSKVVYVEAASAPTGLDATTPFMEETYKEDDFTYWGIADGEFLFAYSLNGDSELVVSPRGE